MAKLDGWDNGFFNEFKTAEEVACATRVEASLKESGIELTGSFELMLRFLKLPVLNFILNAKVAEILAFIGEEISESQD